MTNRRGVPHGRAVPEALEARQRRYDRLRRRVQPIAEGGEGLSMEQAGASETPVLSRARVSAILAKPPAPPGRPPVNDDRDNLQARLRYWERRKTQTADPVRLREIEDEIAGLTAELQAIA